MFMSPSIEGSLNTAPYFSSNFKRAISAQVRAVYALQVFVGWLGSENEGRPRLGIYCLGS